MTKQIILLLLSALLAPASAAPAEAAKGPLGTSFTYHVWGNGIPGLPLFYADGAAVFTDYETASLLPSFIPVTFTFTRRQQPPPSLTGMGYSFLATPDLSTLMSMNPAKPSPSINATLFVGSRSPESHAVGFTDVSDPNAQVVPEARLGGFMNVDTRFMVVEDDGFVKSSLFCAFPVNGKEGVWELKWNVTSASGQGGGLPVTLRTTKWPKNTEAGWHFGTECRTMP